VVNLSSELVEKDL
jgi:chromosome segregation ATPase